MRVIGIDPGTLATGYGVVEEKDGRLVAVQSGSIRTSPEDPIPKRLRVIHDQLVKLIQSLRPDAVGVEKTFVAKNSQSALKLGQAHGIALLVGEQAGLPIAEFSPTEIKQAVVGYGAARKEQVGMMVTRLLGLEHAPESDHAADALAAAICYHHSERIRRLTASVAGGKPLSRRTRGSKRRWTSVPKGMIKPV